MTTISPTPTADEVVNVLIAQRNQALDQAARAEARLAAALRLLNPPPDPNPESNPT